jgi:MFS family permease
MRFNNDEKKERASLAYLYAIPIIMLYVFASTCVKTIVPKRENEYFGTSSLFVVCMVQGIGTLATAATVPFIGKLSDRIGRKILMLLGIMMCICPIFSLWYTPNMWTYSIVRIITQPKSSITVLSFAYISDVTTKLQRDFACSIAMGMLGAALIMGPIVGDYLLLEFGEQNLYLFTMGVLVFTFFYILFVVPESLPSVSITQNNTPKSEKARSSNSDHSSSSSSCIHRSCSDSSIASDKTSTSTATIIESSINMPILKQINYVARNKTLFNLILLKLIGDLNSGVIVTINMHYCQTTFGFTSEDIRIVLSSTGLFMMLSQLFILPLLLKMFPNSSRNLMFISTILSGIQSIWYGTVNSKLLIFVGVALNLFCQSWSPLNTSLISKEASEFEQGMVQGIAYAASSIGTALGMQFYGFAFLFAQQTTNFVGFPLIISGLVVLLITLYVMFNLSPQVSVTSKEESSNPSECNNNDSISNDVSMRNTIEKTTVIDIDNFLIPVDDQTRDQDSNVCENILSEPLLQKSNNIK